MFEKIRAFSDSPYGLWLITAHSSLVQLWLESECQMLFDITYDHSQSSRRPSFDECDPFELAEVHSLLYHDEELWLGTVDGYLMLYRITQLEDSFERKGSVTKKSCRLRETHKYPPGKRLSPVQSSFPAQTTNTDDQQQPHDQQQGPVHSNTTPEDCWSTRQTMYYIPTDRERHLEELTSAKEYPESSRQTRKISVIIDPSTKQYKGELVSLRTHKFL